MLLLRKTLRLPVYLGTLDGPVHCVSVLVHEYPADLPALEHAVGVATATNARLFVIIVPSPSRWGARYLFTTLGGTASPMPMTLDELLNQAIKRSVAETLRQVPRDLPVTLRAMLRAQPRAVADILAEAGSQLVFAGARTPARWRRVLARQCRKAQHTPPGCLGRWLPSEHITASGTIVL